MTTTSTNARDARGPLTLEQACLAWNALSGAPAPDRSTIARWCREGVKGIKLGCVVSGGRRFITVDQLQAFYKALNAEGES